MIVAEVEGRAFQLCAERCGVVVPDRRMIPVTGFLCVYRQSSNNRWKQGNFTNASEVHGNPLPRG